MAIANTKEAQVVSILAGGEQELTGILSEFRAVYEEITLAEVQTILGRLVAEGVLRARFPGGDATRELAYQLTATGEADLTAKLDRKDLRHMLHRTGGALTTRKDITPQEKTR
jgi:hypothetical protein